MTVFFVKNRSDPVAVQVFDTCTLCRPFPKFSRKGVELIISLFTAASQTRSRGSLRDREEESQHPELQSSQREVERDVPTAITVTHQVNETTLSALF